MTTMMQPFARPTTRNAMCGASYDPSTPLKVLPKCSLPDVPCNSRQYVDDPRQFKLVGRCPSMNATQCGVRIILDPGFIEPRGRPIPKKQTKAQRQKASASRRKQRRMKRKAKIRALYRNAIAKIKDWRAARLAKCKKRKDRQKRILCIERMKLKVAERRGRAKAKRNERMANLGDMGAGCLTTLGDLAACPGCKCNLSGYEADVPGLLAYAGDQIGEYIDLDESMAPWVGGVLSGDDDSFDFGQPPEVAYADQDELDLGDYFRPEELAALEMADQDGELAGFFDTIAKIGSAVLNPAGALTNYVARRRASKAAQKIAEANVRRAKQAEKEALAQQIAQVKQQQKAARASALLGPLSPTAAAAQFPFLRQVGESLLPTVGSALNAYLTRKIAAGEAIELPRPVTDTGAELERVVILRRLLQQDAARPPLITRSEVVSHPQNFAPAAASTAGMSKLLIPIAIGAGAIALLSRRR